MKRIILASSSPRRKEILERFNVKFETIVSKVDEDFDSKEQPSEVVQSLALKKCKDVADRCKNGDIVIAADTIVYYDQILGKPKDRKDAFDMISRLSGKTHLVMTGLAIIEVDSGKTIVDYEVTKVKFRDLNSKKIERYLNTEEYTDKAGAYGIQGYGEILVESINGSFSNVVGLPISKLDKLLEENFNLNLLWYSKYAFEKELLNEK